MADVVEVNRFVLLGPGDSLDGDVEHTRNRDGAAHAAHLDRDRLGLGALEMADERAQRRHRPAVPAARDGRQRIALVSRGALVENQTDRPVTLGHRAGRPCQDREAQTVEPRAAVQTLPDAKHESDGAVALGRTRRHTRSGTRTHRVAAPGLEVLAADLPSNVRHDEPPSKRRRPSPKRHIELPPPRSPIARSGRTATATPRSISIAPITYATRSPRGTSFSAATAAATSRTQGRPIAPATTRTTMSAQQQPRQYSACAQPISRPPRQPGRQ